MNKLERTDTYILCCGIAEEGVDFGENENHNAIMYLEDNNGKKVAVEYFNMNEFCNHAAEGQEFTSEEFFDSIVAGLNTLITEGCLEGIIQDDEIIEHIERFRFSLANKSFNYIEYD
jgi:hypothetical protein